MQPTFAMSTRNKKSKSQDQEQKLRRRAQLEYARRKIEEAERFDRLMDVTDWTCQSD